MPEFGTVRHSGDVVFVWVGFWIGSPPVLRPAWATYFGDDLDAALRYIPEGAVVDMDALKHGEVVVLSTPLTERIDDSTLEALEREAETLGRTE